MRRPRNSVDEAIKKLSLSSTGEHQTQTTIWRSGKYRRSIFRMILYLFISPNNSLPFLNEKHFEIIHLFRANDSTTARHFFVFSAKQCGKSAALGVSWELTGGSTTIFAQENALSLSLNESDFRHEEH